MGLIVRVVCGLMLLSGVAWGQGAGSQEPDTARVPATLRLSSALVQVPVEVQTKKGEMLYGLMPEQFALTDNGVAQTVKVDEDTDARGLSLVVVVQCSREAFNQFDRMKGLAAMVDDLTGDAPRRVALVSYGGEPTLLAPLTSDPAKLGEGFAQLQPCDDGDAATLDAVDYALHLLDEAPATGERRAVLLVSETRDHGSHLKPEAVVASLGRTNTVLDAVSFSPGKTSILDSLLHGRYGPGALGLLVMAVQAVRANVPHALAELSGGEYTNFTTQKGFDAGVHRLANHIHNFYLLSYRPAADATAGLHRIEVKVPDYPDAKIRSRLAWYAGAEASAELPAK